jgi:hypothetical protein
LSNTTVFRQFQIDQHKAETPIGMSRGKFEALQAMLVKRLMMWGKLSQGGKEILIKAVA